MTISPEISRHFYFISICTQPQLNIWLASTVCTVKYVHNDWYKFCFLKLYLYFFLLVLVKVLIQHNMTDHWPEPFLTLYTGDPCAAFPWTQWWKIIRLYNWSCGQGSTHFTCTECSGFKSPCQRLQASFFLMLSKPIDLKEKSYICTYTTYLVFFLHNLPSYN